MPLTNTSPHFSTEVVRLSGPGSVSSIFLKLGKSVVVSRTSGVSIQDMWATPTATPWWATSRRSAFAKCSTPALDASYGAMPGAEFQAGNLTLALMQNEAFGQAFRPNSMPIALRVADVEAARERLLSAGVRFTTETFDSGVCHQAIFLDPAGNPLDLHRRYAPVNPGGDQAAAGA